MAESQAVLNVYNQALSHVGNAPVAVSTDSTICTLYYPTVRDTLLSWHAWTFATMRRQLARLTEAPAATYLYQYAIPSNPYPLRILDTDTRGLPYTLEVWSDDATPETMSRVLLTDAQTVVLRYIARVQEALWPPLVLDVAAYWLAVRIVQRLTGKTALRTQLYGEMQGLLQRAIDLDGHQEPAERAELNSTYLSVRGDAIEALPLEDFEEPF